MDLDFIRQCVRENPGGYTDEFKFVLAALDDVPPSLVECIKQLALANEREARLRAALNAISNNVLTDPRAAARAALATGVGSEGTDTGVGSPETAEAE